MTEKQRRLFILIIMSIISISVAGIAVTLLYQTGFREEKVRLTELVLSQAHLIESVARFDARYSREDHPEGWEAATLSQIVEAHKNRKGFGGTGEFLLATREDDNIVFLVSYQHDNIEHPMTVLFNSEYAQPMKMALSGKSGVMVGLDYCGEPVLAAYEPVEILNLGIVAKIDLAEVRAPYVRTGIIVMISAAVLIAFGVLLIYQIIDPVIRTLSERALQLKEMNIQLVEQVEFRRQKEEEMKVARIRAEEASRAKSEFLASMSHELRTPLNAVIGFSDVLEERYFGELNEKQDQYIRCIQESGRHLLSLINNILDLTSIETGRMELDLGKNQLYNLLEDCIFIVKEQCQKQNLHLQLNLQPDVKGLNVRADERKVKQVLNHLLSNAIKFTPEGGEIKVQAEVEGQEVVICVIDSGIGIPQEEQDKIFHEFYQIRGGIVDKTPGTGLGLTLVKRIVELHEGRVWVESEGKDRGSRFCFTLALDQSRS
jgi:signal transduction histidine kinase